MGESFGHYRLEELLGRGGVGEVWRALDTNTDRQVALKMLLPEFRGDLESAKRFRREARLAAKLAHDHIVHVNAFGEIEGRLYIDMVYVKGADLGSVLAASGRFGPARALHILDQVADALDAAHAVGAPGEQRMVHRDVKPGNVLLAHRRNDPDHVYLVDFGVARALVPATIITEPGAVAGTPHYMPPEMWESDAADHRVDVYATAVMLFEMLTGRLPYTQSSLSALIGAHVMAPIPRASTLVPSLPAAFDDVIARGMAKKPDDRYDSVGELAVAARAALTPPPSPPVPAVPPGGSVVARPTTPPNPVPPPVQGPSTAGHTANLKPAPPPIAPRSRTPFFASRAHFTGLAAVLLVVPLALLGAVHLDGWLLAVAALLYVLGAVVGSWFRRPPRP